MPDDEKMEFKVHFPDVTLSSANDMCDELFDRLRVEMPGMVLSRIQDNDRNQDAGAVLLIILGSSALTTLIREVSNWTRRRYGTSLEMRRTDKKGRERRIIVKGPIGDDVKSAMKKFFED